MLFIVYIISTTCLAKYYEYDNKINKTIIKIQENDNCLTSARQVDTFNHSSHEVTRAFDTNSISKLLQASNEKFPERGSKYVWRNREEPAKEMKIY